MNEGAGLQGYQRKYLRGLAHPLKPVVMVGREGLSDGLFAALEQALDDHELIKLKFNDFKSERKDLTAEIAGRCACEAVGLIGNTAILYRARSDPDKRVIRIPERD